MTPNELSVNRFRRLGHAIALIGLGVGLHSARHGPKLAILPAAILFGWTQTTGL